LRDLMQQNHVAVLEIRGVNAQLDALKKRLSGDAKAKDIISAVDAAQQKMNEVEDALIQSKATASEDMLNYPIELNSKIGYLINGVDSADSAPPQQDWDLYAVYQKQVDGWVSKWKAIVSTDLAQLNQKMRRANIPMVAPQPVRGAGESGEAR
jgi:DNA-binding FrmR family transcriptional regulator